MGGRGDQEGRRPVPGASGPLDALRRLPAVAVVNRVPVPALSVATDGRRAICQFCVRRNGGLSGMGLALP